MILASGKKGYRYALPNSRIMTCPPRMNRAFGNVSNCMIKANELENATQVGRGRRGRVLPGCAVMPGHDHTWRGTERSSRAATTHAYLLV